MCSVSDHWKSTPHERSRETTDITFLQLIITFLPCHSNPLNQVNFINAYECHAILKNLKSDGNRSISFVPDINPISTLNTRTGVVKTFIFSRNNYVVFSFVF